MLAVRRWPTITMQKLNVQHRTSYFSDKSLLPAVQETVVYCCTLWQQLSVRALCLRSKRCASSSPPCVHLLPRFRQNFDREMCLCVKQRPRLRSVWRASSRLAYVARAQFLALVVFSACAGASVCNLQGLRIKGHHFR